jgi:antirestriction protein ArdC
MRNLHREITDRILVSLKAGALPWRKPWASGIDAGAITMPRNAVTARQYSGINVLLLWSKADACGYSDPRWLTFKQALELGGNVRKGEKGTEIVFVSKVAREDKRNPGETVFIPFLKSYWVFNVAQCEKLDKLGVINEKPANVSRNERDATIDEFVRATGAEIRHVEARAYYARAFDFINMPALASFESAHAYYATLFHEIAHWTGDDKRLKRVKGKKFGDREYAYEELVAELASAFVCAEFGIDNHEQNAAYLATWLQGLTELLEANDRAIVSAAADASRAVEFMRSLASAAGELEPVLEPAMELLEAA